MPIGLPIGLPIVLHLLPVHLFVFSGLVLPPKLKVREWQLMAAPGSAVSLSTLCFRKAQGRNKSQTNNAIGNPIGNPIGNSIGNNSIGNSIKKILIFPIPLLQ